MKRKSWEGGGRGKSLRLLGGALPSRHCVEWVKGSNSPREVSETMAASNALSHVKKKKKKEEGAGKEREATSGKIFCAGSSGK